MKLKKKMMALALVASLSVGTAYVAKEKETTDAKFWAGVVYVGTKQGKLNAEESLAISGIGIVQSAIHGAAWGCAFGGPAGIVAGAAASVVVGA